MNKLRALINELIEKYDTAEQSNINERSSDFEKDYADLEREIQGFRQRLDALLERCNCDE